MKSEIRVQRVNLGGESMISGGDIVVLNMLLGFSRHRSDPTIPKRRVSEVDIRMTLESGGVIFLARTIGNRTVGVATLFLQCTLKKGKIGNIRDIAFDEQMKFGGIRKALIMAIVEYARHIGLCRLHLLCNAEREEANRLYRTLGFEKREMNPYQLKLS